MDELEYTCALAASRAELLAEECDAWIISDVAQVLLQTVRGKLVLPKEAARLPFLRSLVRSIKAPLRILEIDHHPAWLQNERDTLATLLELLETALTNEIES